MNTNKIKSYIQGIFSGLWMGALVYFIIYFKREDIIAMILITLLTIGGHIIANIVFRPIDKKEVMKLGKSESMGNIEKEVKNK